MDLGLVLTYFRVFAAGNAFVRRYNTVSFTSFQLCSLKYILKNDKCLLSDGSCAMLSIVWVRITKVLFSSPSSFLLKGLMEVL